MVLRRMVVHAALVEGRPLRELGADAGPLTITWHLAPGAWHLAPGTWHSSKGYQRRASVPHSTRPTVTVRGQ